MKKVCFFSIHVSAWVLVLLSALSSVKISHDHNVIAGNEEGLFFFYSCVSMGSGALVSTVISKNIPSTTQP
jgi:hypothetical protein